MVEGMYLTVHIELTHTPCDELRILRSEIEDQYLFLHAGVVELFVGLKDNQSELYIPSANDIRGPFAGCLCC